VQNILFGYITVRFFLADTIRAGAPKPLVLENNVLFEGVPGLFQLHRVLKALAFSFCPHS
jgi:hypothetical protein